MKERKNNKDLIIEKYKELFELSQKEGVNLITIVDDGDSDIFWVYGESKEIVEMLFIFFDKNPYLWKKVLAAFILNKKIDNNKE